jgi:hypothetical protein
MSSSRNRDATSTRCDRARRVALVGLIAVVLPLTAVVGCDDTEDEPPSTVTTVSGSPTTAQDQTRDTSRDGTGDQTPDTERDRDRTDQTG